MKCFVKKTISMLLTLVVIVGIAAAGDFDWVNVKSYADGVPSGGKCGDNAYWVFSYGKLIIAGNGKMYDYNCLDENKTSFDETVYPAWCHYKDCFDTVEIGNDIESIGNYAFYECDNIKSVDMPFLSTEKIGRSAFEGCNNLTSVKLSGGLKEIGPWAFCGCTSLRNIDIPDRVTIIEREAFAKTGLEKIVLPNSVKDLVNGTFSDCKNLENAILPENLQYIGWNIFAGCSKLGSIEIPEAAEKIGRNAFDSCVSLREINIPDNVNTIEMHAFDGCTNLNSIRMSKNITYIDEEAFDNTGYYNNKSNWENGALYIDEYLIKANNISGNYYIKTGTKSVARRVFECCDSLTSVIVPASVKSFSYNPFYECSNLNKVVFLGRKTEFNDVFATNEADMTFYCFSDSYAYNYAQEKGIRCVSMDGLKTGDATGDKVINSTDALKVLQFAVGRDAEINEFYPAMNVNMDESVNSSDALAILQYSVGMIDRFRCSSVNSTDEDNFAQFMAFVIGYGREYTNSDPPYGTMYDYFMYNFKDYDYKSSDAFEDAFGYMLGLPYYSIFTCFASVYGWSKESTTKEYNSYPKAYGINEPSVIDPLKKYDNKCYAKVDGEKFDLLLKKVFNVNPNHDFILRDKKSRWFGDQDSAYYYNDYYYILGAEGGDGAGPKTVINDMKTNSDGEYVMNITYQWGNDFDGYDDIAKLNVTAELINLDGDRVWSLYSFEKVI